MTDFDTLAALEQRVLWLRPRTIHNANHLRPADDLRQGRRTPGLLAPRWPRS